MIGHANWSMHNKLSSHIFEPRITTIDGPNYAPISNPEVLAMALSSTKTGQGRWVIITGDKSKCILGDVLDSDCCDIIL